MDLKLKHSEDRQRFTLVEELCFKTHLKGRKRMSHTTINTWFRNMTPAIRPEYKLCSDGKMRAVVTIDEGKRFVDFYRERKSFKLK